jgi:hypothetical protein
MLLVLEYLPLNNRLLLSLLSNENKLIILIVTKLFCFVSDDVNTHIKETSEKGIKKARVKFQA